MRIHRGIVAQSSSGGKIDFDLIQSIFLTRIFAFLMTLNTRQQDRHGRTASDRATDRYLPAMHVDEFGYDRESETGASVTARPRRIGAVEGFEDAEEVLPRDADSRILHGQLGHVFRRLLDCDADMTASASFCPSSTSNSFMTEV
jgi:hypothetical protein